MVLLGLIVGPAARTMIEGVERVFPMRLFNFYGWSLVVGFILSLIRIIFRLLLLFIIILVRMIIHGVIIVRLLK